MKPCFSTVSSLYSIQVFTYKMKKQVILNRATFVSLIAVAFTSLLFSVITISKLSLTPEVFASESKSSDDYSSLKVFSDVLALIRKNYVEEVDVGKLVDSAIKGMLIGLDPHSSYLPVENYKELQVDTKGEFGGLGIEITVRDGLLTVVSPIEDSPAARAGVKSGDKIIKIGDKFAKDLTLQDAVSTMRGPKGSPITISVAREGVENLLKLVLIRDVIKVISVRSRGLGKEFGYVRLSQFQDGSSKDFDTALSKLEKENKGTLRGLVVDLRDNPGGLLTEAIRISDVFLKSGVIVYTDGRLESQKQKYYAHDDKKEPEYPVIVLVNAGSASASEIVSGSLQDAKRALILGKKTFGKGSVQTILPMEAGSALRLTTALYFTRSGRSIQAQGVSPDIVVSDKKLPTDSEELAEPEEQFQPHEKDLPGAIKNPTIKDENNSSEEEEEVRKGPLTIKDLKGRKDNGYIIGSRAAMDAPLDQLLKDDPQLDEALRLLKTWHVFQGKPSIQVDSNSKSSDSLS